jgi:CheY-like chemotaxis protein
MVAATGLLDLHAELEAMALALRQMMGESIAVELELGATRSTVRMERARFHAVVLNLATNARDAMPEGGVLHISTRDAPVSAGPPGDAAFIELTVSDTGTGMDAATAAHVFEPFFTTKEPGMGTGLGLAVTSSTIADAGGSIRFDSEPGSGTRFITLLPMAPAAATTRVELDGGNAAATGVGTVLLVEDEPDVLEVTADVVRTAGYRVVEALSAREAIDFVSSGERPDLLLTDVVMPEMTGIRLAERLSQQLPDLAVLFMSGYAAKADDAASVDPDRVLRKPFSHRQLIERVRRAIEQ